MASGKVLKANMRIVTPVFCAGADQNGAAEIRPFSLRGALRWWYRAIDRDFKVREKDVFGAAGTEIRSSPVALRVRPWLSGHTSYKGDLRPQNADVSGAAYLGYTLYLAKNDRKAVPGGKSFTLELALLRDVDVHVRRAWAASLWFFGHLGGLGTRARRGFGTIALENWQGWPEECGALAPVHGAVTPEKWKEDFERGFGTIREWFNPMEAGACHQHLGKSVDLYMWKEGFSSWKAALDKAGGVFHEFRKRSDNHKPEKLAAFGLPICFRKHPARRVGLRDMNRSASRLHFRVIRISERYHPLVWCARGPLAPSKVRLQYDRNSRYQELYAGDGLIRAFLEDIRPQCL